MLETCSLEYSQMLERVQGWRGFTMWKRPVGLRTFTIRKTPLSDQVRAGREVPSAVTTLSSGHVATVGLALHSSWPRRPMNMSESSEWFAILRCSLRIATARESGACTERGPIVSKAPRAPTTLVYVSTTSVVSGIGLGSQKTLRSDVLTRHSYACVSEHARTTRTSRLCWKCLKCVRATISPLFRVIRFCASDPTCCRQHVG